MKNQPINDIVEMFQVEELEQRLENKWRSGEVDCEADCYLANPDFYKIEMKYNVKF